MRSGWAAARYSRNRCLSELFPKGTVIPLDRVFMRGNVAGEFVAAAAIGARDEVERVAVGGREGRADGGEAGIGDGAGREAGVAVRVVRVLVIEIAAMNHSVVAI